MPRSNREWDMLVPLSSVDGSSTSSIVPSEVLRDNAASSNLYSNSSANMSEENGSGSGGIDGYISTASSDFSDDEEDDEADVESDIEYDDGAIEDNEDYNDDSDYNESPISAYGTSHLIRSNHTRSDGNGAINDTENSINLEQETNLQRQKAPITAVPPTAESLKLMNAGKMMNNVNKSTAQNKDNGSKSSGSMDSNAEGATTSESHWTGSYQKNGAYGNGSSENITSSSGHSKDGSSSGQMNGSNSSNSEDPSKSSKDQDSTGSSDSSVDKKGPHEQSKTNVNISQNNSGTISSRSNTASLESSDKSSGSGNTSDKGSSDPNGDPNSEQNSDQNSDHNSDNDGKIGAILGGIPRNVFWGSKVNDDLARRTKTDGVSGIEGITRLSNTAPSIDNESKITLASALEHYPPISDTRKAQTILRDGVTNTNSKKSKTKSLTKKLTRNMYRKALKFAMEGQPMDADEAIALEKIVSFNQKLLRYSKYLLVGDDDAKTVVLALDVLCSYNNMI